MQKTALAAVLCIGLLSATANASRETAARVVEEAGPDDFIALLLDDPGARQQALQRISSKWQAGDAVMLVEILPFTRDASIRRQVVATLEAKTGQRLGLDLERWYAWIWSRPAAQDPRYAELKSRLYRSIDPRFGTYFGNERPAVIRLDEVRWGGVRQDGIPPLRSPAMVSAAEATYLEDDNVVFGIEVDGDVRAYPKRILAWHEMFTDVVGGVPVAGVYCTLCGTVILFETELDGVRYELGTSGFLYRSNKLMYDRATQSLWSTFEGRPVIGPLVDEDIRLAVRPVVTTTWGEWRRRHPATRVLSLDTGHQRDYSEGAAYRDYFATDELMFGVPELDRRLKNKDEVLTLFADARATEPLAISADFLDRNTLHHERLGDVDLVVLTDASGANRVYRTGGLRFASWDLDRRLTDEAGGEWRLSESRLVAADGRQLDRFPAQRAFWFGWHAAYPHTRLVK